MGRFEGAMARNQESTPQAEQAARLERKKLALQRTDEARKQAQSVREQDDRTRYLLQDPDRFIMLSENECALAESLLRDAKHKPTKHVIDGLKEVQRELRLIQQRGDFSETDLDDKVERSILAQTKTTSVPAETPEEYRLHGSYDPAMDAAVKKKKKAPIELTAPATFRAMIRKEIETVRHRNKQVLDQIESVVGPAPHVEETSSVLAILQQKIAELEKEPRNPFTS